MAWNRVWKSRMVLCLCELWVLSVDGRSMYLYIVLGGYLRILGAPMFNPVEPYRCLLTTVYLSVSDIANPDLFACGCRTWISLYITCFHKKREIGSPLLGAGVTSTICQKVETAPSLVSCVVWSK